MSTPILYPGVDFEAPPKRAVLLVNVKSRRGREWYDRAQEMLLQRGIELEATLSFRNVQQLVAEAKASVDSGVPMVIAGGGDGTFSSIAHLFAHTQTVMGVLPLGTGNAFARDLGIPAELDAATRLMAEGKVSAVDLGVAGNRTFLNVATVGLTTLIARSLKDDLKRKWGRFVYAAAMMTALPRVKPFRARIETENGIQEFDTLQVVIGNGRFHAGPFPLAPDAGITNGRLTVYALATTSRAAFLRLGLLLPTGRHIDLPEVFSQATTGGRIRTDPRLGVTVDGEVCIRTPFNFGVQMQALRVVTPRSFKG